MPYLHLENETIFYSESIPPLGPYPSLTLVPIHGSGGCGAHWPKALTDLQWLRTCIPDLPGHGLSTEKGRASVEEYAEFMEAFIVQLGLDQVVLMGHSLGGAIAMTVALRAPDWLKGLILVGTGARLRVTRNILDGLLSKGKEAISVISDLLFDEYTPEALVKAIRAGLENTEMEVIYGDFSACDRFDLMGQVNRIFYPTLIVSAEKDRLTPPKYGEYLHSRISGSVHTRIKNAGHMMALEKPDEFMAAIQAFFGDIYRIPPG